MFPRRPSREVETAYALAVGFVLNGVIAVTGVKAGVLSSTEAVIQSYGFAGAMGGLTMALIHFVGIAFAEGSTPVWKVRRAAVEGVCAVIVGAIVSGYFTRYVGAWIPRVDPADLLWLAYAIGVFAWRAMPLFIDQLPKVIASLGDGLAAFAKRVIGGPA